MSVELILDKNYSQLAIQIAALVHISERQNLLDSVSAVLRNEIEALIEALNILPEDLRKVLLWESLIE